MEAFPWFLLILENNTIELHAPRILGLKIYLKLCCFLHYSFLSQMNIYFVNYLNKLKCINVLSTNVGTAIKIHNKNSIIPIYALPLNILLNVIIFQVCNDLHTMNQLSQNKVNRM